ncbi:MAG: hypothetical protein AAF570_14025, partial [Bacteroidota bacterium]
MRPIFRGLILILWPFIADLQGQTLTNNAGGSSFSALPPPPAWCWASDFSSDSLDFGSAVVADRVSGETYVAGRFKGDLSPIFPTGVNNTPNMSAPIGVEDGLVAKYDPLGNPIWAFKVGGTGAETEIRDIAIEPGVGFFITGRINGTIQFAGVVGSPTGSLTSTSNDAFIAKYDLNGNLLWVRKAAAPADDAGAGIHCDGTSVFITGNYRG